MTDPDPDPTDPSRPVATDVPLGAPLPAGLPTAVAAFLAAQAIVTRGQAAVCLACLEVEPTLLADVRLDPDEIRAALDMLRVDVSAAFALMREQIAARFDAPPPGVPLDAPPGAMPARAVSGARDLGDLLGAAAVAGPVPGPATKGMTGHQETAPDDATEKSAPDSSVPPEDPDAEPRR